MKLSHTKSVIFLVTMFTILVGVSSVFAFTVPETYTPLAPLPDVTSEGLSLATKVSFSSYVKYAFNLLIAAGAVAAVFMITWGGFEYMTTDAVNGKTEGLNKIQNAIYGLLMILSSYLILRTIDPRFVNISPTLVEPLQINANKAGLNWLENLQKQINDYNVKDEKITAELNSAIDQNAGIMAEQKTLEEKIASYTGSDDPVYSCGTLIYDFDRGSELDQLCAQWLSNENAKDRIKSDATIKIAQSTISSYSGQALKSPSLIGQKQIDELGNLYKKTIQTATDNGFDSTKFGPIADTYYLADSQMRMAYGQNAPAYQSTQIKYIVETDISGVSDPVTKNNMIDTVVSKVDSLLVGVKKDTAYYNTFNKLKSQALAQKVTI